MTNSTLPRAILFDFDLTLVDSLPGFIDCYQFAARTVGLPEPTPDRIGRMIGIFLPDAVRLLYPDQPQPVIDEFIRVYQQRADEAMTGLTHLIPGAAEAVHRLRQAGIACGIVTQKLRYRIEDVLRRDRLLDHFGAIIGGEDIPAPKPHPGGLLLAMERLSATTEASLYAGDTTIDAQTAANAALPFIAVLTGVTTREEFAPFPSLIVLDSVAELPAFFGLA